jgi:DHA1 family tetracycline resistance protein-like MFS transporter
MNKALVVILAAVTIDSIGIGLVFPILPDLLRDVSHQGDVATLYGMILSIYALMQFVFSPVLGMLSDRFGRRPVLLVSLAGAALDYVIMAVTPDLWVLVLGRAFAGLTSANMAVATAYLTDISEEEVRAKRFGMMSACFGVGFILGPVLGGLLGDIWVRAPFLLAAGLNALNLLLALFVLPESRPGTRAAAFSAKDINPFGALLWALTLRGLLPFMGIYLLFSFIGQVYGTIWVLYAEDRFGWTAFMVGLSLGGFGLCLAASQAVLVGPITKRLGERGALYMGIICEGGACLLTAFAGQGWMLFILLPLFALGGVGMPALQSLATRQVSADQQGQLQGVLASLMSLSAIVGPIVFSGIYFWSRDVWIGAVWIFCVLLFLVCAPIIWRVGGSAPSAAVDADSAA